MRRKGFESSSDGFMRMFGFSAEDVARLNFTDKQLAAFEKGFSEVVWFDDEEVPVKTSNDNDGD